MPRKYTKKKGRKKGGTPPKTFAQQTLASKSRNLVIPQLEKEQREYPFEEYLKDVFEELYRDSYNETIAERIAGERDVSQTIRTNMVQTMKDVMETMKNKKYKGIINHPGTVHRNKTCDQAYRDMIKQGKNESFIENWMKTYGKDCIKL